MQKITSSLRNYWRLVQQQGVWFITTIVIVFVLAGTIWLLWEQHGDKIQIPETNIWIATVLSALNLSLSFWALPREPFASKLLLGATLIEELLAIAFLYLV